MIKRNSIKQCNPRKSKGSACQKAKKIHSDSNIYSLISKKFIYKENRAYPNECTHKKVNDNSRSFFRHISVSISVFYYRYMLLAIKKECIRRHILSFIIYYDLIILFRFFFPTADTDDISHLPHQTSSWMPALCYCHRICCSHKSLLLFRSG